MLFIIVVGLTWWQNDTPKYFMKNKFIASLLFVLFCVAGTFSVTAASEDSKVNCEPKTKKDCCITNKDGSETCLKNHDVKKGSKS